MTHTPPTPAELRRRLAARDLRTAADREQRIDSWLLGRDAQTLAEQHLAAGDLDAARDTYAIAARHGAPDAQTMLDTVHALIDAADTPAIRAAAAAHTAAGSTGGRVEPDLLAHRVLTGTALLHGIRTAHQAAEYDRTRAADTLDAARLAATAVLTDAHTRAQTITAQAHADAATALDTDAAVDTHNRPGVVRILHLTGHTDSADDQALRTYLGTVPTAATIAPHLDAFRVIDACLSSAGSVERAAAIARSITTPDNLVARNLAPALGLFASVLGRIRESPDILFTREHTDHQWSVSAASTGALWLPRTPAPHATAARPRHDQTRDELVLALTELADHDPDLLLAAARHARHTQEDHQDRDTAYTTHAEPQPLHA
uniref:hypothetical protein n=2 Tax=Saccharothrix espanaensis TaxID=103731 RepID=UPI003F49693F